jgi:hypothetical protein
MRTTAAIQAGIILPARMICEREYQLAAQPLSCFPLKNGFLFLVGLIVDI